MDLYRITWVLFLCLFYNISFGCDETDVAIDARNVLCNGGNSGRITVYTTFSSLALPYQYSINGGPFTSDSVFTGLKAGNYLLTVRNSLGCDEQIPITITEPTLLQASIVAQDAVCGKDGKAYPVVSGGTPPYLYSWNTTPPTGIDTLRNLLPGTYELTVRDQNGCTANAQAAISGPPIFQVRINPENPTISFGETIQLNAEVNRPSGNFSFQWIPENGLSCSNCNDPIATVFTTTTYVLFVSDTDNGCKSADTVTITVSGQPYVFIPNAFTPNGDQRNDVLKIYGTGISTAEISIYDTRGFLVYKGRYEDNGWDGNIAGSPAQEGLYFYSAEVSFVDGSIQKLKGQITLFR